MMTFRILCACALAATIGSQTAHAQRRTFPSTLMPPMVSPLNPWFNNPGPFGLSSYGYGYSGPYASYPYFNYANPSSYGMPGGASNTWTVPYAYGYGYGYTSDVMINTRIPPRDEEYIRPARARSLL